MSQQRDPKDTTPEMAGEDLIREVVEHTGLPNEWAEDEISKIITDAGHSDKNLTLEELRSAMLTYLESIQSELMEESDEITLEQ